MTPFTSQTAHMHRNTDQPFSPFAPLAGYQARQPRIHNQPYTLPEYIAVLRLRLNGILEKEFDSTVMQDWMAGGIMRLEDKIIQWENYQRIKNGQPVTGTKGR